MFKLPKALAFLGVLFAAGNLLLVPLSLVLGEYADAVTHVVAAVVAIAMLPAMRAKARRI